MNDFLHRMRSLFRRNEVEDEMKAELRFHLEREAEKLRRAGLPEEQAQREARLRLGGVAQAEEECRDARGTAQLESIAQDARFALRMLRKSPAFTAVAVLTLALGIGATTALFSVVEAVLLRPLPYKDAGRLAVLWTDNVRQSLHQERTSYPNFEDWQKQNTTLEGMAFASAFTVNLTGAEDPERLMAARASAGLFPLMGVQPLLGRTFSAAEEERGERVILVGEGFWRRQFAASYNVVGKTLEVDGTKMTILGVMPAAFEFPSREVEIWEPLTVVPNWSVVKSRRNIPSGFVVARLKAHASFTQAQADMNVIANRLASEYPDLAANRDFFGFRVNVVPFKLYVAGPQVRSMVWLLFGAVVLVLCVACTNVASLLLSRGVARTRELATRMALGAGRNRLVRQLLTETALLYLASGAVGIVLAAVINGWLVRFAPSDIPHLHGNRLDSGVLCFALGLSFVTALVFGLFPAVKVSGSGPQGCLKASGRNLSDTSAVVRLRSVLVTLQFAVAVILLIGAGLLIRSFLRVQNVYPGFKSDHVLTARVVQSKLKSPHQWADFYQQVLDRIRAIPGVDEVGAIDNFFFASFPDETVVVEGHSAQSAGSALLQVTDDGISPGYFESLGVPLLRGRFLGEQDRDSSPPTAIVNATMSRRFWANEDPVGKRFKFGNQATADPWITVVGVVGDMHRDGVTREPVSQIFLPLSQHPARGMDIIVRTSSDPRSLANLVRAAIRSADKSAPVFNVTTLEEALREQDASRRFQTLLLSVFALLAVVLAGIGIYGLMHFSVTQRTQEIGIRMALGAQQFEVARLVLRDGGKIAFLGVIAGLAGAFSFARVLKSLLFGVSATDPGTFVMVAAFLSLIALAACYIPARRAARIDPIIALRYE